MKKIVLILLASVLLWPAVEGYPEKKKAAEEKKEEKKEKKDKEKIASSVPDGYSGLKWKTPLSQAKNEVVGSIKETDEKTKILTRDGDIEYLYGFFYKDPQLEPGKGESADKEEKESKDKSADSKAKEDEGRLYYVSLRFPYLPLESVKNRFKEYGEPTNESVVKDQGAVAWNGTSTIVIIFVDRYRKKPYCRRIVYVSKDMITEAAEYNKEIFNKNEAEILNRMKLK